MRWIVYEFIPTGKPPRYYVCSDKYDDNVTTRYIHRDGTIHDRMTLADYWPTQEDAQRFLDQWFYNQDPEKYTVKENEIWTPKVEGSSPVILLRVFTYSQAMWLAWELNRLLILTWRHKETIRELREQVDSLKPRQEPQ